MEIKADPCYHQSLVQLGKEAPQAAAHVPVYPGWVLGGRDISWPVHEVTSGVVMSWVAL